MYEDLTKLLGGESICLLSIAQEVASVVILDITKFLDEQVKDGTLKPEAVRQALKLIDRSKNQIQKIDAVAPQNDDYVIMHNNGIN